MATQTGAGERGGGGASPSPGRGGRGGGRGKGGRGRSYHGRNSSSKGRGRGADEGNTGSSIGSSNGGSNNGRDTPSKSNRGRGGRRHFSARGGSAGRGSGGGGRGGGSSDNNIAATNNKSASVDNRNNPKQNNPAEEKVRKMSEQDVLIAFGPYVRSGDPDAKAIHQEYLSNSRQREFIKNARKFLVENDGKPPKSVDAVPSNPPTERKSTSAAMSPNNKECKPDVGVASPSQIQPIVEPATHGTNDSRQNGAGAGGTNKIHSNGAVQREIVQGSNPSPIKESPRVVPGPSPPPKPSPPPGLQPPTQGFTGNSNSNNIPPRPPPGMGSLPPPNRGHSNAINGTPPPGMPPPTRPPKVGAVASPPPNKPPASSILPARTPPPSSPSMPATQSDPQTATTTATPAKPARVRRTQTRCEEQPGRLFANDMPAEAFNSSSPQQQTSLIARPRSELTARWVLPLPYLRHRALRQFEAQKSVHGAPPQNLTIRDALKNLTVGLFRRGAMESGSQSSIVSKEILATSSSNGGSNANGGKGGGQQGGRPSEDYFFNVDQRTDSVFGTVPFYAPRTPGNVLFRLYFDDEPQVTLATGPCIRVLPTDSDVDSVLRFILSNFKSKKTNGISSMNSLASVLELFAPRQKSYNDRYADAGRVAWGCICESRKAVEAAGLTFAKKKQELEEKLEAEKIKEELPDLDSLGIEEDKSCLTDGDGNSNGTQQEEEKNDEKKKMMSDARAKWTSESFSNERRWRETQLIYASILKAAVSNDANQFLLKRDILAKMRLEYELWCPLVEKFAPNPFLASNNKASWLPGDVSAFPHSVTKDHISKCEESRAKMQQELLGFVPRQNPVKAPQGHRKGKKNGRIVLKELSVAMEEIYQEEYAVSDEVWKRREAVRSTVERTVTESGEFPPGTKVTVFGSSANGFGSPNSDLDLCLQVPSSATQFSKEENGVEAMTNLAAKLTEAGMTDVDTVRLTARIPIVKFNVPYNDGGEKILVECDLSLQNPLACLNTSLLHAYSKISHNTCVLASIIKRWAKSREINNPSEHTLSSYGYVIMLIHFLTSHTLTKSGNVVRGCQGSPILPNLQWVDPLWAQNPAGPYREIPAKPKTQHSMVQHPTEAGYFVNSYFYSSGLLGLKNFCASNCCDDSALGTLLAAFYHYFAYDFDYKKHVVSLSSKQASPPLEREIKAEEDGWSLFRHGLAIEDPFELFYDVAHVVKATNFQHIRKEFCLAYTKIVNSSSVTGAFPTGRELIDSICEPVDDDKTQIQRDPL